MLVENRRPFYLALFVTGVYSSPIWAQEHEKQVHKHTPRVRSLVEKVCGSETCQGKGDVFLKKKKKEKPRDGFYYVVLHLKKNIKGVLSRQVNM